MHDGPPPLSHRMSAYDFSLPAIDGSALELDRFRGSTTLFVNVASACGLTPQYAALQALQDRYADRGFTVVGIPCNQFAEQEPGGESEIAQFCSDNYGISFPLTRKLAVNGVHRHPLYGFLTQAPDAEGVAGDVRWNFEKFLVRADGSVAARVRPFTPPDADDVVETIERELDAAAGLHWAQATAADVAPGDRVRLDSGTVFTATRVEQDFLGRPGLLGLIEDSPVRWFARPLPGDAAVEILRAA
jgi:glutathione peroxidase